MAATTRTMRYTRRPADRRFGDCDAGRRPPIAATIQHRQVPSGAPRPNPESPRRFPPARRRAPPAALPRAARWPSTARRARCRRGPLRAPPQAMGYAPMRDRRQIAPPRPRQHCDRLRQRWRRSRSRGHAHPAAQARLPRARPRSHQQSRHGSSPLPPARVAAEGKFDRVRLPYARLAAHRSSAPAATTLRPGGSAAPASADLRARRGESTESRRPVGLRSGACVRARASPQRHWQPLLEARAQRGDHGRRRQAEENTSGERVAAIGGRARQSAKKVGTRARKPAEEATAHNAKRNASARGRAAATIAGAWPSHRPMRFRRGRTSPASSAPVWRAATFVRASDAAAIWSRPDGTSNAHNRSSICASSRHCASVMIHPAPLSRTRSLSAPIGGTTTGRPAAHASVNV